MAWNNFYWTPDSAKNLICFSCWSELNETGNGHHYRSWSCRTVTEWSVCLHLLISDQSRLQSFLWCQSSSSTADVPPEAPLTDCRRIQTSSDQITYRLSSAGVSVVWCGLQRPPSWTAATSPGAGISTGVVKVWCGLQHPLCHPPEQLLPLLGRHGVAALQQVGDDERLLDSGGLDPHTAVHPHHQLTGEQLLQVWQDLTVGGQQSEGGPGELVRQKHWHTLIYTQTSEAVRTFWRVPERRWRADLLLQTLPSHWLVPNCPHTPAPAPCLYWLWRTEQTPGPPPAQVTHREVLDTRSPTCPQCLTWTSSGLPVLSVSSQKAPSSMKCGSSERFNFLFRPLKHGRVNFPCDTEAHSFSILVKYVLLLSST